MSEIYSPLVELSDGHFVLPGLGCGFVIVCEHASCLIPASYSNLGLSGEALTSHIAWDPGALGVARELRVLLSGDLVAGCVSRLLYDCNRPPEALSAMPERSEIFDIPGNHDLSESARAARVASIYEPFRAALSDRMAARGQGVLVTIHSFTPVYAGVARDCEIGLLHDDDSRLADAMLARVGPAFPFRLELNVPYSARDGVTHTLKEHALKRGWLNVMIEIRNDLIATPATQYSMALALAELLSAGVAALQEQAQAR